MKYSEKQIIKYTLFRVKYFLTSFSSFNTLIFKMKKKNKNYHYFKKKTNRSLPQLIRERLLNA